MTQAAASGALVDWPTMIDTSLRTESFLAGHRIHQLDLFTDDSLAALIDRYPKDRLQVFTMGRDPADRSEWQPVDTSGATGADIMRAVQLGRLWVKLMRVDQVDTACRKLVRSLYRSIQQQCPGIKILWLRPLLLISSPGALVYYHADPQPTMLWQLRGNKRVWVYPVHDERFLDTELMEQIYAGEVDEEAPYRPEFDHHARVYDLSPGQLLCWPNNAPHRVTNLDSVNVSLSVPYGTWQSERRSQLYLANYLLRRRLGFKNPSVREEGIGSFIKCSGFRVLRKLRVTPALQSGRNPYLTDLRIDANSPTGVSRVKDGPVQTPF